MQTNKTVERYVVEWVCNAYRNIAEQDHSGLSFAAENN